MAKLPANVTRLVVGAVIVAIVVVGGYFAFFRGSSEKHVRVRFASAIGVYVGTPVKILGVNVGHVTRVHANGAFVAVDIAYASKYRLAADASAIEVANSLVSDRYIQLTPLAEPGQPALPSSAVILMSHTGGPAELDDIYAALNKLSKALGPNGANKGGTKNGALTTLLRVAAQNLQGNGTAIGNSITQLSQAARTLANNRGSFFGTVRNLQKFTAALKSSDAAIRTFNEQLAQVASDLASERTDLGAALHDLALALDDVNHFIRANAAKFHKDVVGLEDLTGVLVKQKSSLNETLQVAPIALANIVHAYQPDIGAIATRSNLASFNSATNTDPTRILCSLLEGLAHITPPACKNLTGLLGNLGSTSSSGNGSSAPGIGVPGLIGAGS
jgi:phospholipid/cholesterol/gamma-HCH transport system substrate-binding protein